MGSPGQVNLGEGGNGRLDNIETWEEEQAPTRLELPPPPQTGTTPLTRAEIEAVRGLRLAAADLQRRDRELTAEIALRLPPGATLTGMDPDQGLVGWTLPGVKP